MLTNFIDPQTDVLECDGLANVLPAIEGLHTIGRNYELAKFNTGVCRSIAFRYGLYRKEYHEFISEWGMIYFYLFCKHEPYTFYHCLFNTLKHDLCTTNRKLTNSQSPSTLK